MNRKWFLKGALAGLALSLSVTAGADQQTYTVLKAHQLDPGANKEGTVFTFPAVTIGSTNGVESVNYASVKTGTDLSKANWADDSGNAAVAYVVKITKPWSKNKAGEVTLLSMKIGAKYGFGGGLTIPEFVWAHDEERSGDEAFPSYKVTAIADTVLKFLTKVDGEINGGSSNYYTNLTAGKFANIYLSPLMPKVLGSGKIKTYGLLKGEGDPTTGDYASFGIVHVDPTWAVLESNTTVKEGPNFYDPKKVQVEGAESVVRDLQFGLGGDNRDLEVSKADLDAISKFIASATPVTKADDLGSKKDNKGKLVKKSTAQLRIGGNLKDKLPNKYLTLGKELFTVDSLAWRFATIAFGNEVAGNFNDAAFAAIQPIHKLVDLLEDEKHQQPDFIAIDLSNVKLSTDKETVFDLKGDGLFEGLTIGVVEDATTTGGLALPKGLTAIGNKWFKDATIHALGAIATYDEDEGEYTIEADNLGSSLISIGDEAFRNGFIGNGDEFLANVKGTDLAYNNDGSFTDASKPLTIGKSAFQGFRFDEYPAVEDVKVAQLDLSAFQRAIAIGDSAFADITYPHLYAAVKEEGSLLDVIKNLDDSEAEVYFFPAINFSALKHVQTLGKGIFANDHIYIAATDIKNTELGEGKKAINLPFEHLISAPADVFKSAAFITGGLSHPAAPAVTADDESIYFEDLDTIPFHAFTFSENIAPGAEINKAAFPEDTIYVHFTTFEKWKYALTGSKLVSDYGFKGATFENGKDRNDELVKIVTGSTGAIANWKQSGEYEITYAFAHNSRARTISFYNAYQAAKRWYTI
ncbi:MAG: hypothetical protein LBU08_01380, partial [Tannerellaceae bacterium]|nr:hypothetical protein [Tannerellaceae bacterium]